MREALRLYENNPAIEASIIADQNKHAMQKKATRAKDKLWVSSRQMPLVDTTACAVNEEALSLSDGRPRMLPIVVYVFMWARGVLGSSLKHKVVLTMLQESTTFSIFLLNHGICLPGASTVIDQINSVSRATRNLIYTTQLQQIKAGLY